MPPPSCNDDELIGCKLKSAKLERAKDSIHVDVVAPRSMQRGRLDKRRRRSHLPLRLLKFRLQCRIVHKLAFSTKALAHTCNYPVIFLKVLFLPD